MKIDQLIYLVEVARFKSISLAAEHLHISQPTVSQALNELEKELGKKLFYRSRLGTTPTEDGEDIIKKAKEILYKIEEIKEDTDHNSKRLTGTLSISSVPGFGMSLLPKALVLYKEMFPNVTIKIFEGSTPQIEEEVTTEKIDLGFIALSNKHLYDDNEQLLFKQLISGEVMACVGQKSPLSSKNNILLKELLKYPIVPFKPGYQLYNRILKMLNKHGEPNIMFNAGITVTGKQILAEGIGVGFCPSVTIKSDPYFISGKLVAIPISDENIDVHYGYLRLKNKHVSRSAKELIRLLESNQV